MITASKSRACEIAVGVCAAHQREQIVFAPVPGRRRGHNLLRQDIERAVRNLHAVQFARANRAHQRRAFDQFVARGGEDAALGHRAHPVTGAADALQRDGDGARRADLADQIDRADVDAQLERCRRHDGPQLAALQPRFRLESQRARKAAMMRQHGILAQPLGKRMRHALGQAPRVHEDQRGAIGADQLGDAVVDLAPTSRWWQRRPARLSELRRLAPWRGDGRR